MHAAAAAAHKAPAMGHIVAQRGTMLRRSTGPGGGRSIRRPPQIQQALRQQYRSHCKSQQQPGTERGPCTCMHVTWCGPRLACVCVSSVARSEAGQAAVLSEPTRPMARTSAIRESIIERSRRPRIRGNQAGSRSRKLDFTHLHSYQHKYTGTCSYKRVERQSHSIEDLGRIRRHS